MNFCSYGVSNILNRFSLLKFLPFNFIKTLPPIRVLHSNFLLFFGFSSWFLSLPFKRLLSHTSSPFWRCFTTTLGSIFSWEASLLILWGNLLLFLMLILLMHRNSLSSWCICSLHDNWLIYDLLLRHFVSNLWARGHLLCLNWLFFISFKKWFHRMRTLVFVELFLVPSVNVDKFFIWYSGCSLIFRRWCLSCFLTSVCISLRRLASTLLS